MVDEAAERILAAMARMGLLRNGSLAPDKCDPPAEACLLTDVASVGHAALA